MNSMWSKDILTAKDKTPLTMFVEQASALSSETSGAVKGVISKFAPSYDSPPPPQLFRYEFNLYVKALDYTFTLLELRHEITGYPAYIYPYAKIGDEIGLPQMSIDGKSGKMFKANNDVEMEKGLGSILACTTTTNIVKTLLKQASHFSGWNDDVPF